MLSRTFVGTTLIYEKKQSQVQVQHIQHMASSYRKCQQRLQVSSSKLPAINHNQGAGEELTIGRRNFHHANKTEDRTCTDRNRHDHVYTRNTVGGLIVRLFVDSARCASAHGQAIPGWPGLVSMAAKDVDTVTQQSTVDYMPPVLHSVTENSTVQHILQLSVQATTELQSAG